MDSILNAFRFTQQYASLLMDDIDDSEMTKLPHSGMNHPAWILGHLALVADLAAKLLGEEMSTDDAWMQTYGPGSIPVDDRGTYPSKLELLQKFKSTCERAESLASGASSDQLAAENETPFFPEQFPTVGDLLTHLLTTHAAMHLGQLSAWRRAVGKGSVLGI